MASRNPYLTRAMRRALYSTMTLPLAFVAGEASAQDVTDGEPIEEVITTGSRIARDPNIGANVPVQSVGSEEIQLSGMADLGEILNDLPSLLGSNSASNSMTGIFGTGSGETAGSAEVGETILQLRGLGVERTLVLVDGRRHVAGVGGSQAVDIGSIPQQMIERVEVLTGGASAIYGADAVTGVVNFIMKDNYEGLNIDVNAGMAGEGDAENLSVSGLWGMNFAGDKANVTVGVNYTQREKLQHGDRSWSRNNGVASDDQNPALRFQTGDIDPTATPNFARFYSASTAFASTLAPCSMFGFDYCYGFHPTGFPILTADEFTALWRDAFPGDPDPTFSPAELALIDRAANSPTRAILPGHNFSLSSTGGVLLPGSIFDPGLDLDNNGVNDCSQSYQGYYSTYSWSPPAFGFIGGCWIIEDNGNVRPLRDGLIAGDINQFGPDGIADARDQDYLMPDDEKLTINITGNYELNDSMSFFYEAKWAQQVTKFHDTQSSFWDLLTIAPDNFYIAQLPPALAAVGQSEGLFITRDPIDTGDARKEATRETTRFVVGLEGETERGWTWEVSANFGQFDLEYVDENRLIVDRWFAAIDVIDDGSGNPICRSDVDPTPPPTTPFQLPVFVPGFFTFNPGDGQCRPANILGGVGAISQQAIDFITDTVVNNFETEQVVLSAVMSGEAWEMPAGPVGFAAGIEWRDETSTSMFDPLVRGILPVTTSFGNAGQTLAEVFEGDSRRTQRSLVFDSGSLIDNVRGSYDAFDIFGELSVPLLSGKQFAEDLTLDAAVRFSDYSTIGSTTTWKLGGSWMPVSDSFRLRGAYSVAVRAPNVDELFSPSQGAFFRPIDPCDQNEIDALLASGNPTGPIRETNCRADGIPEGWVDPLTARFVGAVSGNPDLNEEEATTITAGFIFSPERLAGLTVTVDFWDIEIEDAIDAPSDQDIVDGCYDSLQFPDNQFCPLVVRQSDMSSPQFLGLQFIQQQQLNIGKLEAAGVDFAIRYQFDLSALDLELGLAGTWMDKLDRFFDPSNPAAVDPELGELQRPEWAGNFTAVLGKGPFALHYQMQYMDEQGLRGVEIETIDTNFGPAGMADATYIHDISMTYDINDQYRIYGGINNLTDEEPFLTEYAFPVSPIGRFIFVGLDVNL